MLLLRSFKLSSTILILANGNLKGTIMEEICKNCWHYNDDTEECEYYEYDKFHVNEYDDCQIKNSADCFESR